MSTFGGDSWVPENVYRKRRVDELLGEAVGEDDFRKLSDGKLACLVCPNHPVLDSMPMLIVHRKGAGHQRAAERKREKEQRLIEEIQKRIGQGSNAVPGTERSPSNPPIVRLEVVKKTSPLLAATEAMKSAVLRGRDKAVVEEEKSRGSPSLDNEVMPYIRKASRGIAMESQTERIASSGSPLGSEGIQQTLQKSVMNLTLKGAAKSANIAHWESLDRSGPGPEREREPETEAANAGAMQELYEARERELRFREAGWRRDGAGGWFRDENVEFDSDEEVPDNVKGAD